MNRKKNLILTAMLSLLCINKTYAACTQQEINDFKKVEDEFKVTYEFNKETKDYTITLYSPDYSKYGFSLDAKTPIDKYHFSNPTSLICEGIKPGEYTFDVKIVSETCNEKLKTIQINLPKYNKYSEDPLCDGIEEFVLCQPTYDKEIDYDTFVSRINTYKRTQKETEDATNEEKKENKILENIFEYIKQNALEIIIVVIFMILMSITIILTTKSIKKSRRLE